MEFSTKSVQCLENKLSPFRESGRIGIPDQPFLVTLPEMKDQLWTMVFSTKEALVREMEFFGVTDYKIKVIGDTFDFAESIFENGIRIMLDPRRVDNKTRWTEITREIGKLQK